jgi:uncharacterized membrane protein
MRLLRELLAAAALWFTIITVAASYPTLPQRIPTHFNAAGIVNRWGDKSTLWIIVLLAGFLYAVLTIVVRFAPASTFNVPVPAEQRGAAILVARDMIAWVKAESMCLLAFVAYSILAVAERRTGRLSLWFLPVTLVAVFATIAFYLARMMRLREANI